jgi:phosphate transport system substrate-binding protein
MNMKQFYLIAAALFFLFCAGMDKGLRAENRQNFPVEITPENYPRVDGSTSTEPLNILIACRLLGWRCEWQPNLMGNGIWQMVPNREDAAEGFFGERVKSSQTHQSILHLIDGQTDLILSARKMSEDERAYAESAGVELLETPIALDALDFLVNRQNPVASLTADQIRDIYLGRKTHWNQLGGTDTAIRPFIRNANSGSQEMMKEIVMNHAGMPDWETGYTDDEVIPDMASVYREIADNPGGICFTPHYYKEYIIRDAVGSAETKTLAIDGIHPDAGSIRDKTYPFVAEVYVSIRSDLDRSTTAYQMYEWLQTQAGQAVIAESGYVPIGETVDGTEPVGDVPGLRIYPNPVTDGFYVTGLTHPARLTLTDLSGRLLLSEQVTDHAYIPVESLPEGAYIAVISTKTGPTAFKIIKKR